MSKIKKYILIFFALAFFASASYAQDLNYSQFYKSPLVVNPANTGNFEGDWRISNINRSQWLGFGIPYNTFALGFDKPLNYNDHKISGGALIMSDKAGDGSLMRNSFHLSASYYVMQGRNTLIVGLQPGIVMSSINMAALTYPDQYDRNVGFHDPNNDNGEDFAGESALYADVNVGIFYKKRMGFFHPEAGLSFYHVNMPNQSFISGEAGRQPIRFALYASGWTNITNTIVVAPKIFITGQENANFAMAGGILRYNFSSYDHRLENIYAGAFLKNDITRLSEGLSFTAGFKYGDFDIGFSYDINDIGLDNAVQRLPSFELSIIFISPSYFHEKATVPCDRM